MMRNKIALIIFISILVLTPLIYAEEECKDDLSVYIQFKAMEEDTFDKISKYQAPNYKEDDLLTLWSLVIKNEGSCGSPEVELKMNMINNEETINHFFCGYQLQIPSITEGETYYIVREGIENKQVGDEVYKRRLYKDSNGKNMTFCGVRLQTTGHWKAELTLTAINSNEHVGSWRYSMVENNKIYHPDFKVRARQEVLSLEHQKCSSLASLIVVGLIGLFTILVQILLVLWQIKKKKEFLLSEQNEIISNLFTQLDLISSNLEGHKKEFNKKKPLIPSYFVYKFNSNFYLTKLWEKINDKTTKKLKEELNKLEQKIDNINRMIELLQNSKINKNKRLEKELMREIKAKDFKYHKHAETIIKEIKLELNIFIKN